MALNLDTLGLSATVTAQGISAPDYGHMQHSRRCCCAGRNSYRYKHAYARVDVSH